MFIFCNAWCRYLQFCRWYGIIPFVCHLSNLRKLFKNEEIMGKNAISWFECNNMKMNNGNCHLLISGNKHKQMWVKRGSETIWENCHLMISRNKHKQMCVKRGSETIWEYNTVHFLVMTIDYDLVFQNQAIWSNNSIIDWFRRYWCSGDVYKCSINN